MFDKDKTLANFFFRALGAKTARGGQGDPKNPKRARRETPRAHSPRQKSKKKIFRQIISVDGPAGPPNGGKTAQNGQNQ